MLGNILYCDETVAKFTKYSFGSKHLLISFSAMGSTFSTEPFAYKFCEANQFDLIHVAQPKDSFYQNLTIDIFYEIIKPEIDSYEQIIAYGASLGGYCAFYFGGSVGARIIAASPINPPHPSLNRKAYRNFLFKHSQIADTPKSPHIPIIFFDPYILEDVTFIHTNVLKAYPLARLIAIPHGGHDCLELLKEAKILNKTMRHLILENEVESIFFLPNFHHSYKRKASFLFKNEDYFNALISSTQSFSIKKTEESSLIIKNSLEKISDAEKIKLWVKQYPYIFPMNFGYATSLTSTKNDENQSTSANLNSCILDTGDFFQYAEFSINYDENFDAFYRGFNPTWKLEEDHKEKSMREKIPFDWDPQYINEFQQDFEPSRFYRNVVTICSASRNDKPRKADYLALLDGLLAKALTYSTKIEDARFSIYKYQFKRTGYFLKSGWVSAIGNGFMIRGLVRIFAETGETSYLNLAKEYVNAYFVVNSDSIKTEKRWFSWIDAENFLWFDEYPGDDNQPSLVLNGHIHALYGLFYYLKFSPIDTADREKILIFLNAGLTTIKFNSLKFRRYNKVNRYSLREDRKADYLPDRTVRQQGELFRLTGDSEFSKNSRLFARDIEASKLATSL